MSTSPTTITDVARVAGVSKAAVSFALNDKPGVAAETRERILAVARELGWTPSLRGRALSVSRALAVGLVIARTPETLGADPFFGYFISGIETVLSERGYALMLQVVSDGPSEHESYRQLAANGRVDGVFLTDMRVDDERPQLLADLRLPTVVIGPAPGSGPWTAVNINDQLGIAAAVEHLVALGHRNIAHVSGPTELVHSVSRRKAWEKAVSDAGLPPGPCITADFSAQGGANATSALLGLDQPPTAIVYANDLMAIAGMSTAISLGVEVPGRLSVTGLDDAPLSAYIQPALTTVRTDVVGWGRAAARQLLAVIDREDGCDIDLPAPEFVIRASTAPPCQPGTGAPSKDRRGSAPIPHRTES
ncbi:MAG TPA: LacI family DNA-binding transcriptional regulator [Dermatophilaceae bacterium]|nr:LacI family DNA-binding transcriptional regulator [Dermatophilaceae bacterium]